MPAKMPSEPKPEYPPKSDKLYWNVKEALAALPFYFETETVIRGLDATDLFTLNDVLGATIEQQVVFTLNRMRSVWDPDDEFEDYGFIRQAQTFPDVLLKKKSVSADPRSDPPILGIELKGWYLLAKEGEPSYRFKVTPAACAKGDLLCVVPWALSDVISGSPIVFEPYIESAKYAAEARNFWWSHVRETKSDESKPVTAPTNVSPYPAKSDKISDKPGSDSGSNFGRFARVTTLAGDKLFEIHGAQVLQQPLSGIKAEHWLAFFQAFKEKNTEEDIKKQLTLLTAQIQKVSPERNEALIKDLTTIVTSLGNLLKE